MTCARGKPPSIGTGICLGKAVLGLGLLDAPGLRGQPFAAGRRAPTGQQAVPSGQRSSFRAAGSPVVRDRLRSPSISSRCARTTSRRWWPANRSSRPTSSATAGPLDSADATSTTCCASTAVTTTRTGHTARCSCCRPRVVMDGFTHPTGIERETQMHADGAPASNSSKRGEGECEWPPPICGGCDKGARRLSDCQFRRV